MNMPCDPSGSTRRKFLAHGLGLAGLAAFEQGTGAQASAARASDDDEALDRALERLHQHLPDENIYRSNHVSMVIEALDTLERPAAIDPWFEANVDRAGTRAVARGPIDLQDWRAALADPGRFADWQALFLRELEQDDWKTVVGRWAPRLAPGLAGAATHGVIRAGHAARALAAKNSEIRRRELATGLAFWAAAYQELPWDGSLAPEPGLEAALAKVAPRQPAVAPPRGNIVVGLGALADTPSFRPVAGLIDTRDPLRTLHEITAGFARVFLRHPERPIHFAHAVTAPSALRLLLPALDEESARAAVRYAWQAAAGLYVVYADPRNPPVEPKSTHTDAELVDAALEVGDAHAIKLTEACLREEAVASDPAYRAAAHAISDGMKG